MNAVQKTSTELTDLKQCEWRANTIGYTATKRHGIVNLQFRKGLNCNYCPGERGGGLNYNYCPGEGEG